MATTDTGLQAPAGHGSPRVVAVVSGRDGVGKSSVVVNLGLALAKADRRVCVWDFDSGPGNVLFLLGLQPRHKLERMLFEQYPLSRVMLESQHGLRLLPSAGTLGRHGPFTPAQERHLTDEFTILVEQCDCFLVDTAAGGGASPAFIASADLILLVLTPDSACLADTSELVQQLENERPGSYQVLVNRVANQNEAWEVFNRFSSLVQEHSGASMRLLGFVPRDESLSAAAMLQRPVALLPDSDPSARTFLRLSDALDRAFARLPDRDGSIESWMRRLRSLPGRPHPARTQAGTPADAPANAGIGPEADLATVLDRLRTRIADALDNDAEAATIAAWIDSIAEAYWNRRGEPAIDLSRSLERLASEPGNEAMLSRLRELIDTSGMAPAPPSAPDPQQPEPAPAPGGPSSQSALSRATPAATGVPSPAREVLSSEEMAEIQRVWAMETDELDRMWESPLPLPSAPRREYARPTRAHSIDVNRFGPQQQIVDMLRKRGSTEEPLADWLRRVGAGAAH
ncbi:MinD/ParA family protein [Thioalkalivibrio sp.]|uniref:MinD/ParA family ATP-binding protein n=1 Tax=Thioalkalivibrio sp. TaxID=2093813 RepID=UPI0035699BB7